MAFLTAPVLIAAETPGLVVTIATDTVDSNDNMTSLREAIAYANDKQGADTITFSNGDNGTVNFHDDQAETILLEGSELLVSTEMSIIGPGAGKLEISGSQKSRIFQFAGQYSAKFVSGLSIRNGRTGIGSDYGGGGILLLGGKLTLDGCEISGNTANYGGGICCTETTNGGARVTLTLVQCTVSGNSASFGGGGIYTGYAQIHLTLVQCTVSGNSTSSYGGGIDFNGSGSARGSKFTMVQSTVSENSASYYGGIFTRGAAVNITQCTVSGNIATTNPIVGGVYASTCTLDLENSIVANSTGMDFYQTEVTLNLKGTNLIEDASIPAGPNVIHGDPLLGPLRNNGGPTFTHAPLAGSNAINAVNNAPIPSDTFDLDGDLNTTEPLPFDQRGNGFPRAAQVLDIGALEMEKSVMIVAAASSQEEGTGSGKTAFSFTVSRVLSTSGDVTMDYSVSGAAVDGTDFGGSLPSGTVTIPDGKTSTTLVIEVCQDETVESHEAFTVTLANPTNGYPVFGPGAVSTINDDDFTYVSIANIDSSADENSAETGTWRVSRSGPPTAIRLRLAITSSSSASAADWSQTGAAFASLDPGGTGTLDIPAGATFVDVKLTPTKDIHSEAAETAKLEIIADESYAIIGSAVSTITIGQNDFVVINTNDSGEGSLRQAIENSDDLTGAETITFEGAVFTDSTVPDTIDLANSLNINDETHITGLGADKLVIRRSAEATYAGYLIGVAASPNVVTLSGLTLSGGRGGIFIGHGGILRVDRCTISGNHSSAFGGIMNLGTLTVNLSTISGNSSSNGGAGGIYTVAVGQTRTLSVFNSTISGNSSSGSGGGLYIPAGFTAVIANSTISGNTSNGIHGDGGGGVYNGGSLTVSNSTITGNSSIGSGGGVRSSGNGKLILANSIVAGNTASTEPDIISYKAIDQISSNGANFIGDASGLSGFLPTDKSFASTGTTLSQLLAPLSDNGGPTLTHALVSGSPAINAGANNGIPTDTHDLDGDANTLEPVPYDQRGAGFLRANGNKVDIGAWETFQFEPAIAAATTDEDVKSSSGLVISAYAGDGGLTTHYKITSILNGTLYQNDGVTLIAPDSFITKTQGEAGLKFLPAADLNSLNTAAFGFTAHSAFGARDADLQGTAVNAGITVQPVNDAPTIITPGLVDQSLTIGESRNVALPLCFTDIDSAPLTYTITANSSGAHASANISGDRLTLRGLDNGVSRISVEASDGTGGTVQNSFQVAVGTSTLTAIQTVTKNVKLNLVTGLFDVVVKVKNTTPFPIPGFRIHVDYSAYKTAHPSLRLENASSPRNRGVVYVDYRKPLAVDGSVCLTLSYSVKDRKFPKRFKPIYTVESFKSAAALAGTKDNPRDLTIGPTGKSILQVVPSTHQPPLATVMPDRTVRLEFPAISGHWYRVSYSPDLIRWFDSPLQIRADGNTLYWTDDGPPRTDTHPARAPARFYRIHQVNAP